MSCINAIKLFDWVLTHPGREACFGKVPDLDIVMHCDRILKGSDSELFVLAGADEKPLVALWCLLDKERKDIYIQNILGDRGCLLKAVKAWSALYPGWTVSGARRKSKKNVQYKVSDFVKQ